MFTTLAKFLQGYPHSLKPMAQSSGCANPEITLVDKCVACQFYDRQMAKTTDTRGVQWGQCRRTAPMLHPINAKSYMIEGVWPHVRDDDWCGEWKVAQRPLQVRPSESVTGGAMHAGISPASARPAVLASLQSHQSSHGNTGAFPVASSGPQDAAGRGD